MAASVTRPLGTLPAERLPARPAASFLSTKFAEDRDVAACSDNLLFSLLGRRFRALDLLELSSPNFHSPPLENLLFLTAWDERLSFRSQVSASPWNTVLRFVLQKSLGSLPTFFLGPMVGSIHRPFRDSLASNRSEARLHSLEGRLPEND